MQDPLERFVSARHQQRHKALYEQMHFMNSEMPIDVDYVFDNDIKDPGRPSGPTEDELIADAQFQGAARIVYDAFKGAPEQPSADDVAAGMAISQDRKEMSPEDYAKWGLEFMGWFNYNLPAMGTISYRASKMKKGGDARFALYELMELYDKKQISWSGTRRFWTGVLTDPSTYLGLGTLGIGIAGRTGVKSATKVTLKQMLLEGVDKKTRMEMLKRAATPAAAAEGAAYGATDDVLRQNVKIGANMQGELDLGQTAQTAAISSLFAGSLSAGAKFLADSTPTNRLLQKVYDGAQEAQDDLVGFLKEFSERPIEIDPESPSVLPENQPKVADPGLKKPETAKKKIKRKGYKSPEQLGDIVRAGIAVDRPDEAEALVRKIAQTFEIDDEGWTKYPGGYFDRKVVVTLPNGKKGELQIWSKDISDVKEDMHKLYEEARDIENNPKLKDRYEELLRQSSEIATRALTAGAVTWQPIYDQIGLNVAGL